jgi:ribosomal-protein-alanine N-acetyltransferase
MLPSRRGVKNHSPFADSCHPYAMHPPRDTLETARLSLRPLRLSDAEAAFQWWSDPAVMQYIPHGADATVTDSISRIGRYQQHQRQHGFTKWLILDRATSEPIGDAGFYRLPDGRPELGYRLAQQSWGQGLATEAATAWLQVAHEWFGFQEVYAFCHPAHAASARVIGKLGFQPGPAESVYGWAVSVFQRDTLRAS